MIRLDPKRRWAVGGAPERNYLWVLSREAEMSEAAYASAVEVARWQGFEVGRLRRESRAKLASFSICNNDVTDLPGLRKN